MGYGNENFTILRSDVLGFCTCLFSKLSVKNGVCVTVVTFLCLQGVGGGTNQPNVITQSVTWSGAKKGQKPTAAIETDCPTDEILLESSPLPKSMKFVSGNHRYQRPEYGDTEEDLDIKLKTLIRMLDNMQRREEKCDWRTCCRPRKTWKKNYWKRNDLDFEDDDYPVRETESVDDYGSDEEDEPVVRRAKRPRYQRTYDAEDVEHVEPTKRVKMVPKMDWLVLKKCPKRYPKRWMKDDVERGHDTHEAGAARDILYIPQSETGEKYRRRTVRDYTT